MSSALDLRHQFRSLHEQGTFVMPNPHDIGTTKLLSTFGFPALATTSAGFASTLGRLDMTVARDELVEHVGRLTAATHLPFNVDSERLYGDDAAGIAGCVALLAAAVPRVARSRTGTPLPTGSTRSRSRSSEWVLRPRKLAVTASC